MTNIGFDKKLLIGSFGTIIITIIIIAVVNFYQTKSSFLSKGEKAIQNVSDVLLKAVQLKYNLQKEKVEADMGALIAESESVGNIKMVEKREADIDIYDINSGNKGKATMPSIFFGSNFVTGEFATVDKVGQFSTSDIAVYQFHEEKLIKVSSSLTNEKGDRFIGEYYSSGTQVYDAIKSEKKIAQLTLSGTQISMQLLKPLFDTLEGEVIGAYSVTSKILTPDLIDLVKKVSVSGNGYSFISSEAGKILIHSDKNYLSLNVSDFKNGKQMLKKNPGPVSYEYNGKKYYAFVQYFKNWNLYFTVAVSEVELMAGVNRQIINSALISGIIALIFGIFMTGIMNRQLMKSMKGMVTLTKEVAMGNFKHTFTYDSKDVIKETVDSMNQMVKELAHLIEEMNSGVYTLSDVSGELNLMSDKISKSSERTVFKINTVASAAEEMSTNMDSVAAAMEQASTNVEIVATGTNEMINSIDKLSQNSKKASEITNMAVEHTQATSSRVTELGRAAEEINKVTDTINNISSQTNLLSLNATIEAARAGEAGKGFAVVANEIKELAGQTAGATEDIAKNIQEIQNQIQGAVTEIQDISRIINQVDEFVKESATAIESQSEITNEIAGNINQVSVGIQKVNENVSQSSLASGQVAHEISDVLSDSQEINEFSSTIKEKAQILNEVMHQLKSLTKKFKI